VASATSSLSRAIGLERRRDRLLLSCPRAAGAGAIERRGETPHDVPRSSMGGGSVTAPRVVRGAARGRAPARRRPRPRARDHVARVRTAQSRRWLPTFAPEGRTGRWEARMRKATISSSHRCGTPARVSPLRQLRRAQHVAGGRDRQARLAPAVCRVDGPSDRLLPAHRHRRPWVGRGAAPLRPLRASARAFRARLPRAWPVAPAPAPPCPRRCAVAHEVCARGLQSAQPPRGR
jgi:hypothetical protein